MPFNTAYYQILDEFLTQNYYERALKQLYRNSVPRESSFCMLIPFPNQSWGEIGLSMHHESESVHKNSELFQSLIYKSWWYAHLVA